MNLLTPSLYSSGSNIKTSSINQNPAFQPPRPITLSNNYNKLIPTLSSTVVHLN